MSLSEHQLTKISAQLKTLTDTDLVDKITAMLREPKVLLMVGNKLFNLETPDSFGGEPC